MLFLLGVAGVLIVITALVAFVPGFLFVAVAPEADHVLNTAATLTAGGVAVLAWIRYRETGQWDSLLQAAAFLVLFTGGLIGLVLLLADVDGRLGFAAETPGQAPLYLWTAQRFIAATLLLIAALAALWPSGWRQPLRRRSAAIGVLAPTVLLLIVGTAVFAAQDRLPPLIPSSTLQLITQPLSVIQAGLISPPMLITQLLVAIVFIVAGLCYGLAHGRSHGDRPYHGYLAVGLVVAAFGQVHFAIVPGSYGGLLTSGDLLRVTFYALVGLGVAAAARHDLVELRLANASLRRLRASDAQRIALEERARLAREVHDGLVQDLWLARLTHGRLTQALEQAPDLPAEARDAADRVDSILEDALAEARQAVVSLQPQDDPTFGNLLCRFVEDYGDRFGLEAECSVEGAPVLLAGRAQGEVLRICREALNNARKHADATLVRVTLDGGGSLPRLTVADNGRGFDPGKPQRRGFGLRGMHERAAEIGSRLTIESQPAGGTRVTLELPQPATSRAASP